MIAFILFMKFQRHQLHWNTFLDQSTSRDVSIGNNGIHPSYKLHAPVMCGSVRSNVLIIIEINFKTVMDVNATIY